MSDFRLTPRLIEALRYADECHRGQVRKGTDIPYFCHPLGVASLVLEGGGDEDDVIAALLHDVVEDSGGSARLVEIQSTFGKAIADVVEECSDTNLVPKPPWRERKLAFLNRVPQLSESARRIVTADKLHNVRSILVERRDVGPALWEKFSGKREGTLWYYQQIVERLKRSGREPQLRELEDLVARMELL